MSPLLHLLNDFVERMMNPVHGALINDEYSMRMGELLADAAGIDQLASEVRRLERVDELSTHAWLWLVDTPQTQTEINRQLLLELCLEFEAPALRVKVIDCALRESPRSEANEFYRADRPPTLEEIANPWLADLTQRLVRTPIGDPDPVASYGTSERSLAATRNAQSMLIALFTVGRTESEQAAVALLHHEWAGHGALLEFFRSRIATMDEASRRQWLRLAPYLGPIE